MMIVIITIIIIFFKIIIIMIIILRLPRAGTNENFWISGNFLKSRETQGICCEMSCVQNPAKSRKILKITKKHYQWPAKKAKWNVNMDCFSWATGRGKVSEFFSFWWVPTMNFHWHKRLRVKFLLFGFFYQVWSSTGGGKSSLPLSSDRTGIPRCCILCNKTRTSPSLLPLLMFLTY